MPYSCDISCVAVAYTPYFLAVSTTFFSKVALSGLKAQEATTVLILSLDILVKMVLRLSSKLVSGLMIYVFTGIYLLSDKGISLK